MTTGCGGDVWAEYWRRAAGELSAVVDIEGQTLWSRRGVSVVLLWLIHRCLVWPWCCVRVSCVPDSHMCMRFACVCVSVVASAGRPCGKGGLCLSVGT